jgi:predicted O-methyltransferase YrrM
MDPVDLPITPELAEYIRGVSLREPDVLRRLREETANHPMVSMQISPEQGQFMALLIHMLGARRTIEVGVFTGYSSLAVALALPDEGRIVACDISDEWTSIARRYWREAGVDRKVDLRLRPATQTLDDLIALGQAGGFDFAFIDADKANYDNYYERCLTLIRPGGLIAVDNVLWSGKVVDPAVDDADTRAIRAFNEKLKNDARVWLSLLPIRDGLTLASKKG